eukprot:364491-Chlamydomonas_euryale.AAC.3
MLAHTCEAAAAGVSNASANWWHHASALGLSAASPERHVTQARWGFPPASPSADSSPAAAARRPGHRTASPGGAPALSRWPGGCLQRGRWAPSPHSAPRRQDWRQRPAAAYAQSRHHARSRRSPRPPRCRRRVRPLRRRAAPAGGAAAAAAGAAAAAAAAESAAAAAAGFVAAHHWRPASAVTCAAAPPEGGSTRRVAESSRPRRRRPHRRHRRPPCRRRRTSARPSWTTRRESRSRPSRWTESAPPTAYRRARQPWQSGP